MLRGDYVVSNMCELVIQKDSYLSLNLPFGERVKDAWKIEREAPPLGV